MISKIYTIFIKLLSLLKILPYIFLGLKIGKNFKLHGSGIKIGTAKLIKIGNNFEIGRFSRIKGKINIGNNVFINEFGSINAGWTENGMIKIGNDVMLGPYCFLQSGDHGFKKGDLYRKSKNGRSKKIVIGNNVWIGAKTVILKGVYIGDNSVIGAGSVVTKNIPPNVVAVGNPCKIKKEII